LSFEQYSEKILKAKHYIQHGEIYQVNLSQCLQMPLSIPPYEAYKKLRALNPAPFSAYLNFGEGQILCSSPERFLQTNAQGLIQTEPIKGTVKRGKNPEEEESLKHFLLTSEKNRAELMMIVDLERNDLGKICQFGSIHVPTLYELRTYATVHHLVSVIRGKLKTKNLVDILQACFPGGSITGAPKLRAMQIIDELEPHNRGIYTGSIGYIDYRRQMDLNIAIRTIMHQQGNIFFPVGSGIVWDSNPTEEYEETLYKGQALISAVSP
ncbi:MAG: aminodeoxychorismate synthase component I, partial [Deltaproteobacteria bacterium]|nr:aminodeoxychorismate synthase component I [Deltaproteobacteria bacterium]